MRSLLLSAFVAVAVALSPSGARADWVCDAPAVDVLVYADGTINIRYMGNDWTYLCNLESTWRGVSPTTCATWVALLEKIKTKGGTTRFYFVGDPIACNKLTPPSYADARIPIYIGDMSP
jgi:hypothetical protein